MEYQDKMLVCVECGTEFVFSASEQLFYETKNFRNEPKRCKECKSKRNRNNEDPLDAALNNYIAITCLRDLYNINDATATILWNKFIGTVRKMREMSKDQKGPARGGEASGSKER
jgi:DNA-directed RNA polymerase subunit RPC12/RpoP